MTETSKATISLGPMNFIAAYNQKLRLKVWPPESMGRLVRELEERVRKRSWIEAGKRRSTRLGSHRSGPMVEKGRLREQWKKGQPKGVSRIDERKCRD